MKIIVLIVDHLIDMTIARAEGQGRHIDTRNTDLEVDHPGVLTGKEKTVSLLEGMVGAGHHMKNIEDREDTADRHIGMITEGPEDVVRHHLDTHHTEEMTLPSWNLIIRYTLKCYVVDVDISIKLKQSCFKSN